MNRTRISRILVLKQCIYILKDQHFPGVYLRRTINPFRSLGLFEIFDIDTAGLRVHEGEYNSNERKSNYPSRNQARYKSSRNCGKGQRQINMKLSEIRAAPVIKKNLNFKQALHETYKEASDYRKEIELLASSVDHYTSILDILKNNISNHEGYIITLQDHMGLEYDQHLIIQKKTLDAINELKEIDSKINAADLYLHTLQNFIDDFKKSEYEPIELLKRTLEKERAYLSSVLQQIELKEHELVSLQQEYDSLKISIATLEAIHTDKINIVSNLESIAKNLNGKNDLLVSTIYSLEKEITSKKAVIVPINLILEDIKKARIEYQELLQQIDQKKELYLDTAERFAVLQIDIENFKKNESSKIFILDNLNIDIKNKSDLDTQLDININEKEDIIQKMSAKINEMEFLLGSLEYRVYVRENLVGKGVDLGTQKSPFR